MHKIYKIISLTKVSQGFNQKEMIDGVLGLKDRDYFESEESAETYLSTHINKDAGEFTIMKLYVNFIDGYNKVE